MGNPEEAGNMGLTVRPLVYVAERQTCQVLWLTCIYPSLVSLAQSITEPWGARHRELPLVPAHT